MSLVVGHLDRTTPLGLVNRVLHLLRDPVAVHDDPWRPHFRAARPMVWIRLVSL